MLYIKFGISSSSRVEDFTSLFFYMQEVRAPHYEFDVQTPDYDWDNMTEEEISIAAQRTLQDPTELRLNQQLPSYVQDAIHEFAKRSEVYGYGLENMFSYIENDFEVEIDSLSYVSDVEGEVAFSTGNYPFGGIERFAVILKAFNLIPFECFDGFNVGTIEWNGDYMFDIIANPIKTKSYLFSLGKEQVQIP
ncbi:hypothetical protein R1T43_08545 [Alteromonas sp. CI.11.F.A3]|uniref:hypothetical protein n=1 Tax=Alteromonas sp. CI.11.F.A3 TaxID=3079555 RepID=UPI002942A5AD|nr:hypothetical protein [Alteromonas sp. CI.11.F.A3]WOI39055.1 hypothetical protein R1T43_08545 [Alteromonas sp. CI.11.F.A3]